MFVLNSKFLCCSIVILGAAVLIDTVDGHGMVLEPVARGSRWRFDSTAPINYDDNGNFCGGFYVRKERIR